MTETMKLQSTIITETGDDLRLDVVYADDPDSAVARASLVIRLPIEDQDYPILPEARLEALRRVRRLVDAEIHEIERARGRTS